MGGMLMAFFLLSEVVLSMVGPIALKEYLLKGKKDEFSNICSKSSHQLFHKNNYSEISNNDGMTCRKKAINTK